MGKLVYRKVGGYPMRPCRAPFWVVAATLACVSATPVLAQAQTYPSRTIKILGLDRARRTARHSFSHPGSEDHRDDGAGGGDRKQNRRQWRRGWGRYRKGTARRLHTVDGVPRRQRHAAAHDQQAHLRPDQGLCSGRSHHDGAEHPGRSPFGAGQGREGTDRLRRGQSRQANLCLARGRQQRPRGWRVVQATV